MSFHGAAELLKLHDISFVQTTSGKFTTSCPHCGNGYLNVESQRDRVVWYCHHCQGGGQELFEREERASELGSIKACFDYTDETGKLLFQVLRFEPANAAKQFRQRTGPDQKKWSIKGVRIVPFKLPELIADIGADRTVFVVEGEKDVLTLRSHGIPATCNPMGAGKWRAEFAPIFTDADVVVCCDNDKVGRDHARAVAMSLTSTARTVRLLDLKKIWPGIEESDDISDWFKRGSGSAEALWQTVETLPAWQDDQLPPWEGNGHDSTASAVPIAQPMFAYAPRPFETIPARQWLHARHYVRRYVVMTVAPGGYGKSSLLLCNAVEMATGVGLIGPNPIEPIKTVYWNAEEAEIEEVERRIAALVLAHKHKIKPEMLVGNLFLGGKISNDEWRFAQADRFGKVVVNAVLVKLVTEFIGDNKIGCAMFDPMVSFHKIAENETAAMETFIKGVIEPIAIKTNACIELSHHTRKPSGGFGGGEITADESRGAGAAVAAARSVRVLNRMTAAEAADAGIEGEERRLFLRIARDKQNMTKPDKARWVRLQSVEIGNGDEVQAVVSWAFPKAFDGISTETMHFMRAAVSKADYRVEPRSPNWVGYPLIQHLGIGNEKAARRKVGEILKAWFENGVLAVEMRPDEKRRPREFVVAGHWRDTEESQQNEMF